MDTSEMATHTGIFAIDAMKQDAIAEALIRHARAAILRYLEYAPGRCLNHVIIRDLLDREGMRMSASSLRSVLEWLLEERLLKLEHVMLIEPGVLVAELTDRGSDVAQNRERHLDIAPSWAVAGAAKAKP